MNKNDKIYVAGHNGLIGSAILRRLIKDGYANIITRCHSELDLCNQSQVNSFFEKEKPDYVFFAAGKVGGVFANKTYRADFIYENLMMQCNVINSSFLCEVKRLIFLSSADAYPKNFEEPIKEEALLTGPLEATCEPFALSKLCGMKMCEAYNKQYRTNFFAITAPNVYGPNQRYDMLNSQVIPSLIKRFHEAKLANLENVVIWGTGKPVRDFLFVDDLVDACVLLAEKSSGSDYFNVGTGHGYKIAELARAISRAVGYKGKIVFDASKPEGAHKKLLDISKIHQLGWKPRTKLIDGICITYSSYLEELKKKQVRASAIHNITAIKKDQKSLLKVIKKSKSLAIYTQPKSYRNKVVIKPWGYEFLVFENRYTAVWMLFISNGNSTSMHCHPNKKTSLIILSGTALSNTLISRKYLKGGDALIIDKGVFHSTKVLSHEGMFLLEIESPPLKTDLARLEDRYGRQTSGYEGVSEMKTANLINEYGYFNFREPTSCGNIIHETDKFTVIFEMFINNADFKRRFKNDGIGLYTSCRGRLLDNENKIVLGTGDTQKAETLSTMQGLRISEKTILMKTYSKDI